MRAPAVNDLETTNADAVRRYLRVFETCDLDELAKVVHPDVIGHGAGQTTVGRGVIEEAVRSLPAPTSGLGRWSSSGRGSPGGR